MKTRRQHVASLVAAIGLCVALAGCEGGTLSVTGTPGPSAPQPVLVSAEPSTPATPAASASALTTGPLPVGRIVFDRLRGNPEGDFLGAFILGTDGVETKLKVADTIEGITAVWSPDGTRLLINSYSADKGSSVSTLDPLTGTSVALPNKDMAHEIECSDWAPDGRSVICGRGGPDPTNDGIYRIDVVTGKATRITHSRFHHVVGSAGECGGGEGRAVYAPDGARFAYVQQKCGSDADPSAGEEGSIVVVEADGSAARSIVPFGDVRTHPGGEISWSPTGNLIAFGTQTGELSVIGADGTGLRVIELSQPGRAYGPTWSPDGNWILTTVVSSLDGSHDLYVVAPDGSKMIRLTETEEAEAYTDWGPAAP
jgi:Tol biopolymer transport system component